MLAHYFAGSVRNLARNRVPAGIDIGGLPIGLAVASLIAPYIRDELTFDPLAPEHERIDRFSMDVGKAHLDAAPPRAASALRAMFPQIESIAQLIRERAQFRHHAVQGFESFYNDASFLDVIHVSVAAGNLRAALGARRRDLIAQFTGESLLYVTIATTMAASIVELLISTFNSFIDRQITFEYWRDAVLLATLVTLALFAGLAARSHPALVLIYRWTLLALQETVRGPDDETLILRTSRRRRFEEEERSLPGVRSAACANELPRALGFKSPQQAIGQSRPVSMHGRTIEIIGVVEDLPVGTVRKAIPPLVPHRASTELSTLHVKLIGARISDTVAAIERSWRAFGGARTLRRSFLNEFLETEYRELTSVRHRRDVRQHRPFIGCLGLFGLSAFNTERRAREIGVRKAMDARTEDIARMMRWQFIKPAVKRSAASPLSAWLMQRWLDGFALRIDPQPRLFLTASGLALIAATLTVVTHCYLATSTEP